MPITFDIASALNSIKSTILDSTYQYLSNDIQFVWFHRGPKFAIAFGNDVIMMSEGNAENTPLLSALPAEKGPVLLGLSVKCPTRETFAFLQRFDLSPYLLQIS